MLIVLPFLLVLQNVMFELSSAAEFNLNITVQCKLGANWCYEVILNEKDSLFDDKIARTGKKCIDSKLDHVNHILSGSVESDGWFFNNYAEVYAEITHTCNKADEVLRIEHHLGRKELNSDKVYNYVETVDLDENGPIAGFPIWTRYWKKRKF